MNKSATTENTAGHNASIQTEALAYAVIAIQALPRERQNSSTMVDMCRLLRAAGPEVEGSIVTAEIQTRRIIDLFPDREAFGASEREEAETLLASIGRHREARWKIWRGVMAEDEAEKTGKGWRECLIDIEAKAVNHPPAGHDKLDGVAEIA